MTDKKKKPVTTPVKSAIDTAYDKAVATVAADMVVAKLAEKLKAPEPVAYVEFEKVEPKPMTEEAEAINIADFDSPKMKSVNDYLQAEVPGVVLSKFWDGDKSNPPVGAIVTIGDKTLLPVGEPIYSSSLMNEFNAEKHDVNLAWRTLNKLSEVGESVKLYHYIFKLGGSITHLLLSEDSRFHVDEKFYGYYGNSASSVTIGVNATFHNTALAGSNLVLKYDVTNAWLKEAMLMNSDPKKARFKSYAGDDVFCNNNWTKDRRYIAKDVTINNSEVTNTDLDFGHYTKSYINRCKFSSGVNAIHINDSNLNTLEITAVKAINLTNCRLSGRVSCSDRVTITGVKVFDLFINDAPVSIEINSQFGWGRIDWMNDTTVRFFTAGDNSIAVSIPHQYMKDGHKPWAIIPIRWEDHNLAKERPDTLGYGFNHNQLYLSSYMTFRRNGKPLGNPDMVQRAFVEYLEGCIDSRIRVLALIRSVADNHSTVVPARPNYYDECPF